jgi:hypothetical protein
MPVPLVACRMWQEETPKMTRMARIVLWTAIALAVADKVLATGSSQRHTILSVIELASSSPAPAAGETTE